MDGNAAVVCMSQVGGYVGQMLAGLLAGWQCDNPAVPLVGGWQGVFYLWGGLGIGWGLLWFGCEGGALRSFRARPFSVGVRVLHSSPMENNWNSPFFIHGESLEWEWIPHGIHIDENGVRCNGSTAPSQVRPR
jgi:MFS family permease